jgi:glutathione S-transferase
MAAQVLGLADRMVIQPADTAAPADSIRVQNPLGKVPCLVLPDGTGVFDSRVIVEFLQNVAGSDRLVPPAGPARMAALVRMALADGLIDAGALIIYEDRYHPPEARSDDWLDYQRGKIRRALAVFEANPPPPDVTDAVSIGLACALGFLDRRKPLDWRLDCRRLVDWLEAFAAHEPAFALTHPPDA